ncbi:MAG: fumarylacetoacetate hydrolase family protein, partial [Microbacterium sp.]
AGYSRDPQIFLRDRSTVTVGVDGIGALTTHCRIDG